MGLTLPSTTPSRAPRHARAQLVQRNGGGAQSLRPALPLLALLAVGLGAQRLRAALATRQATAACALRSFGAPVRRISD